MSSKKKSSGKNKNASSEKEDVVDVSNVSTDLSDDDIDIPVQATPAAEYPRALAATPEQRAHATTAAQDTVLRITEVVITALDKLNDGEKTTLKELQTLVAEQTGLKGSNIGPVISMIVRTHGDVSVELGRYGGIYRGKRVRPEKPVDTKTRCNHCHQVIRQKTGKRKKKNADGTVLAAATTDTTTDDLELEDDDLDESDDETDDDSEESHADAN